MKNSLSCVTIAAIVILTSCGRSNNHVEDHTKVSEPAAVSPQENSVINEAKLEQERTEFRHNSELRIEQNNKKIEELNKKIETADERMRKEYRQRIADLKERNAKAKERLNNYKDNSKDKWEEFKREFNRDMDELGNALQDFTINDKK